MHLLEIADYDHYTDLALLISEASSTSLGLAAETIEKLGPGNFDRPYIANFLKVCARLYPGRKELRHSAGSRYFVRQFIGLLGLETIEWLLDDLSGSLACICGKKYYECDCRNGMSKIIGSMMDRYFELATPPFDPVRVWAWVENVNFHENRTSGQSKTVQIFQEDDNLRQGILAHVFGKQTDLDRIWEIRVGKFSGYSHSGLCFHAEDYKFMVELAFAENNPNLWRIFLSAQQRHLSQSDRKVNTLRQLMRRQALAKPAFMRAWSKFHRGLEQQTRLYGISGLRHSRKVRRRRQKQHAIRAANIQYVLDNREYVESGRHWQSLVRMAELLLNAPEKIEHEFGEKILTQRALRNCLDFIDPFVPDLLQLAELRVVSQFNLSEMILYASCLEILRFRGSLDGVSLRLLTALRTNVHMSYPAVSQSERDVLKNEIDRLIFSDSTVAESFLRQYVEPQLAHSECVCPDVWMLRNEEIFKSLRSSLSIEWLRSFRDLALVPLGSLFEIAAQHGNRGDLNAIIVERCEGFSIDRPGSCERDDFEEKRKFWFLRAWYFVNEVADIYWVRLASDKNTLLMLRSMYGGMSYSNHPYLPKLTARMVEAILEAFIDEWPKVDLPDHWGSGSPEEEKAYRFLTEIIWALNPEKPDSAIPVLERLLSSPRFSDFHKVLKSMLAAQFRMKVLQDFEPPTPLEITNLLDNDAVITVECLRQLVIQELEDFQNTILGGEFNTVNRFYENGKRLDEGECTEIIAERLSLRLLPKNITVNQEHQLKGAKRSDFTVVKLVSARRLLLVSEVKGQWHKELYTAATDQLYERYSIHPDADKQGIFLAIWYGVDEEVAGRKKHGISSARELKASIEATLPDWLSGSIDVFVLDVSRAH